MKKQNIWLWALTAAVVLLAAALAETQGQLGELQTAYSALQQEVGELRLDLKSTQNRLQAVSYTHLRILVLKSAHVLMSGTPAEVFARAEELLSAGLDVPQVTRIAMRLREQGLAIDPAVYTVETLERELLALRRDVYKRQDPGRPLPGGVGVPVPGVPAV